MLPDKKAGTTARILAAITALLAISSAANALDSLFDDKVYSGQSIVAGDVAFKLYSGNNNKEVLADYGKGTLFLQNNSCQQIQAVRLCLDNIELDTATRLYKIDIRAISLKPKLSITRTAPRNEFEMGESVVITASISNTGGLASDVTYTDVFPDGVEVIARNDISGTDRGVKWAGNIKEAETISFTYQIKLNTILDRSFAAKLEYFDGTRMKTEYSSALNFKTTHQLQQIVTLGAANMLAGEINNITVNYTNKANSPISIERLDVIADPSLKFTKIPDGFRQVAENTIRWTGRLVQYPANVSSAGRILQYPNVDTNATNVTIAHLIRFKSTKVGQADIRVQTDYSVKDFKSTLTEVVKSVKTTEKEVEVRTNMQDAELESRQSNTLKLWFQNKNPFVKLKDVVINFTSDLTDIPDIFIEDISEHEQEKVIEKTFYTPDVNSTKGYTITAEVKYATEFGDNFSKKFTFTQTVQPIKNIAILQKPGTESLESGEFTEVSVSILNNRKTKLTGIRVWDNVSGQLEVIGVPSALLTVGAAATETAYKYLIKAPRVNSSTVFHINTTAYYTDDNANQFYKNPASYTITSSKSISVKPQNFFLTVTKTLDDSSIFLGDRFGVEYSIKNPSTETTAKNARIKVALQDEFDLIGGTTTIEAGEISPGETVTISGKEKRRAKKTGTYILEKSGIDYSNQFGEKFTTNTSDTSIVVADTAAKDGPYISIEKATFAEANNTDSFPVNITLKNKGNTIAQAEVEDDGRNFAVALANGSTYVITYNKTIKKTGAITLPQAVVSYEYGGNKFVSGSNTPSITITENPVLRIEKTAPEKASSIANFTVKLKLEALATGIRNLTVHDGDFSRRYDSLKGTETMEYETGISSPGTQQAGAATATYTYEGEAYTVRSNSPAIEISETKPVEVKKELSSANAFAKDDVTATITVKNNLEGQMEITLADAGREWKLSIAGGNEEKVTYISKAEEIKPGAATATYSYGGEEKTANSEIPEFTLTGGEKGKVIKEENAGTKKGILERIVDFLAGIATWKRS